MSPIPETLEVDEQVAITLASIGYLGESATNDEKRTKMSAALGQPDLPTRGEWALAWGPAEHEATRSLWYAASGSDASGAPALAVVIRGTQMSRFESLRLDFELWLDPLPFEDPAAPAGVKVSRGFATEFSNLLAAVDGSTNLTGYQFLSGVLQSEPDLKVNVIGHSLGGATAPIMAMWMKHEFPGVDV